MSVLNKKINHNDIILFTRHLATLLNASLPLTESLTIISSTHDKKLMRKLVQAICTDVTNGKMLSTSLYRHKKYFNPLYLCLVESAEQTGTLDQTLTRLADYLEKTQCIKKKMKRALSYPASVLFITAIVSLILLTFVVPQFKTLFESYGAQLPLITQMVLIVSNCIQSYFLLFTFIVALTCIGLKKSLTANKSFRAHVDTLTLRVPIFGSVINKAILARITRTLSTNLSSNITLDKSLAIIANIANNLAYKKAILRVQEQIKHGHAFSNALSHQSLFPQLMIQMVKVGEESGRLEKMLDRLATIYEDDVHNVVENLGTIIEPLIMIMLGVIIGGFVLAMYLPIFRVGSIF